VNPTPRRPIYHIRIFRYQRNTTEFVLTAGKSRNSCSAVSIGILKHFVATVQTETQKNSRSKGQLSSAIARANVARPTEVCPPKKTLVPAPPRSFCWFSVDGLDTRWIQAAFRAVFSGRARHPLDSSSLSWLLWGIEMHLGNHIAWINLI